MATLIALSEASDHKSQKYPRPQHPRLPFFPPHPRRYTLVLHNITSHASVFVIFKCFLREGYAGHGGGGDEVRAVGGEDGGGLAARGVCGEGVSAVGWGRGSVLLRLHPCVQDAQRPRPAQRLHVAGSSAGTCRIHHTRLIMNLREVGKCRGTSKDLYIYGQADYIPGIW